VLLMAVGIGFVFLTLNHIEDAEQDERRKMVLVARMVAGTCASELAFDSDDESVRTLSRLESIPEVDGAAIYDRDGNLFARWTRHEIFAASQDQTVQAAALTPAIRLSGDVLEVVEPIEQAGRQLGALVLRANTAGLTKRTRDHVFLVLGMALVVLVAAVAAALATQRRIALPVLELTRVTRRVREEHDLSARPRRPLGSSEFEVLGDDIVSMLDALAGRQDERERAQRVLQRYADRLAALRELDRSILDGAPPSASARLACDRLSSLLRCRWTAAIEMSPEDPHSASLLAASPVAGHALDAHARIPLDLFGPTLGRLRAGEEISVRDLSSLPLGEDLGALARSTGATAAFALPLRTRDTLVGALVVGLGAVEEMSDEDMDVAREAAELLAVAITQVRLSNAIEVHTRKLEERVSQRTAELESANEELEAFSYSVSHDLRTPLRTIAGFGALLLEDNRAVLDDRAQHYLEHILSAACRMDALINGLLDYARLGRGAAPVEPVALDDIVSESCAQLDGVLRERHVQLQIDVPLGRVIGNGLLLTQCVANLISNAVTYTEREVTPRVHIRSAPGSGRVRLWIEDNGIGIEKKFLETIFGVFQRLHTRERYAGSGVGLAIVKKAVEHMRGHVGVESEVGVGSRFWIDLPAA